MENESVENTFKKRMNFKLDKIKTLLPQAPHLRRLYNYVALQIKSGTLNISMKPALPYEVSFTSVIDQKLKESIEMNQENANVEVKSESSTNKNGQTPVGMEIDSGVSSDMNQN